jgi:hypothetical protein
MAIFDYTLPSGSQFTLDAPAGTTQSQADRIFYEQVAAGSLVGYQPGQSLTSTALRITKFELSRLDRGTAGVDTTTILGIVQNLPVVSDMPELINVPIQNPVDQTDIVLARGDGLGPLPVGTLTAFQVQTLQAQLANQVNQASDVITQEKGIGKYGFNSLQLEQLGYVKPGTWARFLSNDPDQFVSVMNSPGIWTGQGGIDSLDDLLTDESSQNLIQNQLMQVSYNNLLATGVISNVAEPTVSLSQGQIYTAAGLQPLTALNVLGIDSQVSPSLLGRSTPNTLASGTINNLAVAQTTIGITNRITGEVGALINNASKFGSAATAAWAKSGGIPSLSSLATGINNLPTLPNININQITSGLTNLVPGNLGALKAGLDNLGKASQFSLNFTNPVNSLSNINVQALASGALTRAQGLASGALTSAQGQLTGAVTNVQGQLTGALANAQNLASGSLAQLGSLFSSGGGNLVSGTQIAAGFSNTVKRSTVDSAVTRILGNSKIPTPSFEFPSPAALAQRLDITQAQNILQGLKQQGSLALNQATQLQVQATRIAGQATSAFNRVTG